MREKLIPVRRAGPEGTGEDTRPTYDRGRSCYKRQKTAVLLRRKSEARPVNRHTGEQKESAPRRTRTYNPLIKSQLLCQLSYKGVWIDENVTRLIQSEKAYLAIRKMEIGRDLR